MNTTNIRKINISNVSKKANQRIRGNGFLQKRSQHTCGFYRGTLDIDDGIERLDNKRRQMHRIFNVVDDNSNIVSQSSVKNKIFCPIVFSY